MPNRSFLLTRRFKSEVQQCSIDSTAERTAGGRVGVKGFSRRRRCERSEHPWCARYGPWIGGASALRSKLEATASRRQLHAGGGVARQSGLAPRGRVGKKPEARCSTERK